MATVGGIVVSGDEGEYAILLNEDATYQPSGLLSLHARVDTCVYF